MGAEQIKELLVLCNIGLEDSKQAMKKTSPEEIVCKTMPKSLLYNKPLNKY